MSGLSSAMPRISVIAACVWVLTRPGITTEPFRSIRSAAVHFDVDLAPASPSRRGRRP